MNNKKQWTLRNRLVLSLGTSLDLSPEFSYAKAFYTIFTTQARRISIYVRICFIDRKGIFVVIQNEEVFLTFSQASRTQRFLKIFQLFCQTGTYFFSLLKISGGPTSPEKGTNWLNKRNTDYRASQFFLNFLCQCKTVLWSTRLY